MGKWVQSAGGEINFFNSEITLIEETKFSRF